MNVPFVSFETMHKSIESEIFEKFKEVYRNNIFIKGKKDELDLNAIPNLKL